LGKKVERRKQGEDFRVVLETREKSENFKNISLYYEQPVDGRVQSASNMG